MSTFTLLGLPAEMIHTLTALGLTEPTAVQQQAIPAVLAERDLRVCAPTGTGKTASFVLPLLQMLLPAAGRESSVQPQALILVPTRELAEQIALVAGQFSVGLAVRPRICQVSGGEDIDRQVEALAPGCDLLVATPGRLLELVRREILQLDTVSTLVLDEADRLLDMGFSRELQQILALLSCRRQTLLFSATFPEAVTELAAALLREPLTIEVVSAEIRTIHEMGYLVNKGSKAALLCHLLQQHADAAALVFVARRDTADSLVKRLCKQGWNAAALHGDKSQAERTDVLTRLRNGTLPVLVATDLAARGLDVSGLPLVINFELPEAAATYVHRIGRTGRAGCSGLALSLIAHADIPALGAIEALTGRQLPLQELPEFKVTDKPADEGARKRPQRDKQANRRTAQKRSIKQFASRETRPIARPKRENRGG